MGLRDTGRTSNETYCHTTDVLTMADSFFVCAVRRRLGLVCAADGPDVHGHRRCLADVNGGGWQSQHTELIAAWRQVFREARGGQVPDRNMERRLHNTNIPVPEGNTGMPNIRGKTNGQK